MILAYLCAGVVFLVVGGVVSLLTLRSYFTGRYFVEMHGNVVERGFWSALRWIWVIIFAAAAILFFYLPFWLVRYIITQPI